MSFIVCDRTGTNVGYFSLSLGKELGTQTGAWGADPKVALRFADEQGARLFAEMYLRHLPHVEVTPG